VMVRDALLHYAHFLCIFLLASLLAGELFLFRRVLPVGMLRQLQIVDRFYGIVAGLVILTGISLLLFGLKGPAFYLHNPVFWTKMALFLVVALLSIPGTIAYLRWSRSESAHGSVMLSDAEYGRIRGLLWTQVGVFAFIPLCAAFMANGL
jgi:putative membrane protein